MYYFPNYPNILYMYIEYTMHKISNNKKYNIEKKFMIIIILIVIYNISFILILFYFYIKIFF